MKVVVILALVLICAAVLAEGHHGDKAGHKRGAGRGRARGGGRGKHGRGGSRGGHHGPKQGGGRKTKFFMLRCLKNCTEECPEEKTCTDNCKTDCTREDGSKNVSCIVTCSIQCLRNGDTSDASNQCQQCLQPCRNVMMTCRDANCSEDCPDRNPMTWLGDRQCKACMLMRCAHHPKRRGGHRKMGGGGTDGEGNAGDAEPEQGASEGGDP